MVYLEHNHDTSLNMLAKSISDRLKQTFTYRNIKDLERLKTSSDIVQVVDFSLKDNLEKVISMIDSGDDPQGFLPKILITQSHEIDHTKYLSTMNFFRTERLKVENINDPTEVIYLTGKTFEFESRVQVIILADSTFISKELSLEMLVILADLKVIKYSLRLYDDTVPSEFFEITDFGDIGISGFETAPMQSMVIGDTGRIIASGIDFSMRESYFRMKETGVMRRKQIVGIVDSIGKPL